MDKEYQGCNAADKDENDDESDLCNMHISKKIFSVFFLFMLFGKPYIIYLKKSFI